MSNILPMTSLVSTQVQVYHYLIQHPEGYILKYSKVEAYEFGLLPPLEGIPTANDQNDLSLELLLVGLIILLLPIFTCVAYWLGKKSAKNYNNSQNTKSDGTNFKRKGSSTNPDDRATQNRALVLYEKMKSPLVLPSTSICEASQQTEEDSQEESSLRLESKSYSGMEIKPSLETQSTRPGSSSSEQESLNINGCENSVMNLNDEGKLAVPKFEVNMVRQYSVEQKNADDMVHALNEEKLKLHSNEEQVSKVEVKYHLSFETKDGSLHKIEKQEIKTIYAKGCKEPENNAVMLKNAYENYQNDPASQSQSECVFLNKSSECRSPSTALVPVGAFQRNVVPASSENKICLVPTACEKVIEPCVENNKVKEIETAKSSEVKAPAFQIDDIPHETGKFAKIFKNVEEIGEGGFGRVYRVVHKLDGKIYAVKKALLKLDSFEDLQQKSKVFREVFAMTDLHHPNIVRYSTCWVEIEKGKGKKRQSKAKSQVKVMETQSIVTEEESESQSQSQSQSQQSESESSHTNTSSVGFEWDLGENQDSKTQESVEKKRLEIVARKMESTIMKSLTSYNDEKSIEESSPSHMYQTGNTEYFEGYNLYLYIQMEYCSGQNLRDYLDSLKRECSNKKTLGMFRKILEGVYAIHKRGIFHRDLKPANIFLDENENIKIGDFGLASLGNNEESKEPHDTKHIDGSLDKSYSKTVGTPMYASPEQACGGRYNHKTDIYSLGFILAEMLAGLSTHHERYQLFRLLRDSHELSANFKAKYPRESELILRMTSFAPDERPTAEELISELDKLVGDGNSTGKELACR